MQTEKQRRQLSTLYEQSDSHTNRQIGSKTKELSYTDAQTEAQNGQWHTSRGALTTVFL